MQSPWKLGGVASVVQSVVYVVAVVALACLPQDQLMGDMDAFYSSFGERPIPLVVLSCSLIVLGLLGLVAVAPDTASLLGAYEDGWVRAGRNMALLSLAVVTVYYTWLLSTLPAKASLFQGGSTAALEVVRATSPHPLKNWVAWFQFGGIGAWVAVVGVASMRKRLLSARFRFACLLKAGGLWAALIGIFYDNLLLIETGVVLGGLIGGPLYHYWLGLELLYPHTPAVVVHSVGLNVAEEGTIPAS